MFRESRFGPFAGHLDNAYPDHERQRHDGKITEKIKILDHYDDYKRDDSEQKNLVVGQAESENVRDQKQHLVCGPERPSITQKKNQSKNEGVKAVVLHDDALRPVGRSESEQRAPHDTADPANYVFGPLVHVSRDQLGISQNVRAGTADKHGCAAAGQRAKHGRHLGDAPRRIWLAAKSYEPEDMRENP